MTEERTRSQICDQETKRQQLKDWVTKCDPSLPYRSSLEKALPGSGRWFLEYDFDTWLGEESNNHPRIMWLRGRSGTGKTTLLSLAINYLKNVRRWTDTPASAYFYCSFSTKESQSAINMLGSYIVQLCDQIPKLWDLVDSLHAELKTRPPSEHESPKIVDLEKVLDSACGLTDKMVLFLDAPNESDTSDELLKVLFQLVNNNQNLQLLISSTEGLAMDSLLSPYGLVFTVRMDYRMVDDDIYSYIESRMQNERRLKRLPIHLRNKITRKLAHNARGS